MNKKQTFLCACLILLVNITYSQTNRFDLGFEGGLGRTSLRGTEQFNEFYKPTLGFTAGFFLQYNFKKIISIRTGISGEKKGSVTKPIALTDAYGKPISEIKLTTTLYYATLPVLFRATFGTKYRFFLNAGPYFGYLVYQPTPQSSGLTLGGSAPLKKIDMGISSGFGFSIPIKTKAALSIEIRHNQGLYDISPNTNANHETIKTTASYLLLSYTLKIGQRTKAGE
jgi:hypothetical protein